MEVKGDGDGGLELRVSVVEIDGSVRILVFQG